MSDAPHTIQFDQVQSCVVLALGHGAPTVVFDDATAASLPEFAPIDRAVLIARLRTLADLIESAPTITERIMESLR